MSTFPYTLVRGDDDHEVPVTVHYTAHKASIGATDGRYGLKLEPDESAYIEIDSVTQDDNADTDIDITNAEEREIEEAISERSCEC